MQKHLIKSTQLIFLPLFVVVNWTLIRRKKVDLSVDDITPSHKYVIVANHRGVFDPFVICYSLGFRLTISLTPLRFFVKNSFFKNILLLPFLYSFGCFPARREVNKNSGLEYGLYELEKGQNLVIFPEGKISRFEDKILPKNGVEILSLQPKTKLIPARVRINRRWGIAKSYSLSIGKPFSGKHMTAEQIMDVVYSLKFR